MRRIERLINLLAALLDSRRPLTAEEIRDRIAGYEQESHEAFRRAFERDKETLRSMGIPIETVQVDPLYEGGGDAYTVSKDRYYLPPLDLEPDEAAALRIAAGAVLGSTDITRAGLLKLQIGHPAEPAEGPRLVWGTDLAVEQPHLGALYETVAGRRPIRFGYRRPGAAEAEMREVEPYGLVNRRGHWYLVGRDRARDGVRAFKLSRIEGGLGRADGSYEIPAGFDAKAHLPKEAWELTAEDETTAVVRFDPSLRWWAEQNLNGAELAERSDGAVDASFRVGNLDALISWALGFGDKVEIVRPEEARSRLLEHLAVHLG
ncbi:MAG TPA: WYL domain-containing protein [Actinomycetota bacterium]|jgi:predicted DNA-binding transcriptional regulator YafY|nr:WYL domain-containing protein [Actinomycetota bacterium]